MTREEAIKVLNMVEAHGLADEAKRMAIKALEQEPRWIPVSETLPDNTGWYLVTFKTYDGECEVCELSYRKPENYWTDSNISHKALDNNEVIAWMPLPEPFNAESEDKE